MTEEELLAKGREVQKKLWGERIASGGGPPAAQVAPEFFELVAKFCFGMFWARPGLDRRTRSCITLAALVALGREHEVAMHVRAALGNGLTADEIKEVLLHTAVYAGVPAANSAFAIAQRVLAEEGVE